MAGDEQRKCRSRTSDGVVGAPPRGLRGFQMREERWPQTATFAMAQIARGGSNPGAAAREQLGEQQLGAEAGAFQDIERA
jgi:hypothetical protein